MHFKMSFRALQFTIIVLLNFLQGHRETFWEYWKENETLREKRHQVYQWYWFRDTGRARTRGGSVHMASGCHRDFSVVGTQMTGPDCDQISCLTLLYISSTVSPWTTPNYDKNYIKCINRVRTLQELLKLYLYL